MQRFGDPPLRGKAPLAVALVHRVPIVQELDFSCSKQ